MPPRVASTASQGPAKKKTTKTTRSNVAKGKGLASSIKPAAKSLGQSSSKRALSPVSIFDSESLPSKRFKADAGVGSSLMSDIELVSNGGSLPPSSAEVSMSGVSDASDSMTVSAESATSVNATTSQPPILAQDATLRSRTPPPISKTPPPPRTPIDNGEFRAQPSAAQIQISKTPKAPWLSSSRIPTSIKASPLKKSIQRPLKHLIRTPVRMPGDPQLSSMTSQTRDLFPSAQASSQEESGVTDAPFAMEIIDSSTSPSASASTQIQRSSTSTTPRRPVHTVHSIRNTRPLIPKSRPQGFSAAFGLPVTLTPIKTPGKSLIPSKTPGRGSPIKPTKSSILKRVGSAAPDASTSKSPLSSTLVALMNRTTVDPHAATQAQLNTLNQALEELDAPRPASSMSTRPPPSRPSTSLGLAGTKATSSHKQTSLKRPTPGARPGTSLGINGARLNKVNGAQSGKSNAIGNGHPPVANLQQLQNAANMEARRASTASLALSQSLPAPVKLAGKNRPPVYTTASGRRVVSAAAARAAPQSSPRDASTEDVAMTASSDNAPQTSTEASRSNGPSASAAPSAPLDTLKDCVIFVDVRTEDGEDAGSLFVDMLRGLGAKILTRPGGSLTHIVYKSGLQSTLTRYRSLPEPKPAVVGIGWVVKCVEKREKVDTANFLISLEEEAGSVLEGLKPTNSKGASASKSQSKSIQTKLPFKPVEKGA
ncbi:hypothetical protein CPB86DRAFT_760151 [Serendipita vermifera]|nr:hypothetical protein CPB86DRAFT_760151 [Serendipita vermifera]